MASLYADENFDYPVSCTWDPDPAALATRIDQVIATAGSLSGQALRVNRPPSP